MSALDGRWLSALPTTLTSPLPAPVHRESGRLSSATDHPMKDAGGRPSLDGIQRNTLSGPPQVTVKAVAVWAWPLGVTISILPVVALTGTLTLISLALSLVMVAATPLKATLVAPARFVPLMVTVVPTGPEAGLNLFAAGGLAVVDVADVGVDEQADAPIARVARAASARRLSNLPPIIELLGGTICIMRDTNARTLMGKWCPAP